MCIRDRGIDAENYIRDEFDWIRSALPGRKREKYLEMERTGRSFPLQKKHRELLLKGLNAWESKMKSIGVIDGLGLVSALQDWVPKIQPEYQHILVDECQDFGTSELEIVRRLAFLRENDLFFCGDAAQRISSKSQKYSDAEISIPGSRTSNSLPSRWYPLKLFANNW